MGFTKLFLNYMQLKLKLREFLTGCTIAMVTYCVTKLLYYNKPFPSCPHLCFKTSLGAQPFIWK